MYEVFISCSMLVATIFERSFSGMACPCRRPGRSAPSSWSGAEVPAPFEGGTHVTAHAIVQKTRVLQPHPKKMVLLAGPASPEPHGEPGGALRIGDDAVLVVLDARVAPGAGRVRLPLELHRKLGVESPCTAVD